MKRAICVLLLLAVSTACAPARRKPKAFRIATPYEITSLDPHAWNAAGNFSVYFNFYDGLVTTNPEMQIEPALALSWETPDPLTWVFHLRPGVHFHNGKILTARDVVYSFDRLLKNTNLEMSGYLLYVSRVRALDPLTVEVRTSSPVSALLSRLRYVTIVPAGATASQLANSEDGTGPYRVTGWAANREIDLTRFGDYWGSPRPELAHVTYLLNHDLASDAADLRSGRVQLAVCGSNIIAAGLGHRNDYRIVRRPSLYLKFLNFDMMRRVTPYCPVHPNPFLDRRVREAINLAIDRNSLVRNLSRIAVPASQLVPQSVFGYNPEITVPAFDLTRARALMAEAGLPDGFAVTLHTRQRYRTAAQILQKQLGRIGVGVTVVTLPDDIFFQMADANELSFTLSGIGCPTGDISDILDNCIHSEDPAHHFGIHNYGFYSDPAMDRRIEKSTEIMHKLERRNVLEQISADLVRQIVWVPLYFDEDVYAMVNKTQWRPRADSYIFAAEISEKP